MKIKLTRFVTLSSLFFIISSNAFAGAWNERQGKLKISDSIEYHTFEKYEDSEDNYYSSRSRIKNKFSLSYGFTSDVTIGYGLDFSNSDAYSYYRTKVKKERNGEWEYDSQNFFFQKVIKQNKDSVWSYQVSLKPMKNGDYSTEARLMYGRNFKINDCKLYLESQLRYKHDFNKSDALKLDLMLSLAPNSKYSYMVKFYNTLEKAHTIQRTNKEITLELGLTNKINKDSSFSLNYSTNLLERNIIKSNTMMISYSMYV